MIEKQPAVWVGDGNVTEHMGFPNALKTNDEKLSKDLTMVLWSLSKGNALSVSAINVSGIIAKSGIMICEIDCQSVGVRMVLSTANQ